MLPLIEPPDNTEFFQMCQRLVDGGAVSSRQLADSKRNSNQRRAR